MRNAVQLYLNGRRVEASGDAAFLTLSDWLRDERRLTGTKVVCAEGDCGACTVLLGRPDGDRHWRFDPVNACILGLAQLDGTHVVTIESVATPDGLHPLQAALRDNHASQCGFCTPGFVMALLGHFEHHGTCTPREAKNHTTGNLCRCTGYQTIVDAAVAVREPPPVVPRYHTNAVAQELVAVRSEPLELHSSTHGRVHAPSDLAQLLALRAAHPDARLVAGNTDLGVVVNKGTLWPPGSPRHAIVTAKVPELCGVRWDGDVVVVGANATLGEVERAVYDRIPELSRLLRVFASPQIKAVATLVGNVANGSPIGDTLPALLALDAEVQIQSVTGSRVLPLSELYVGYRNLALDRSELLTAVRIPAPVPNTLFSAVKVCQRKDLDISFVGAAFRLERDDVGRITDARVAYGGVGPTAARLPAIEALLVGQRVEDSVDVVATAIEAEITPRSDVRGSAEGRRVLAGNLYRRFALAHTAPS